MCVSFHPFFQAKSKSMYNNGVRAINFVWNIWETGRSWDVSQKLFSMSNHMNVDFIYI